MPAQAGVTVRVDLSSQTMQVSEDGATLHNWRISSGKWGYSTPNGTYRPQRLVPMHYSRKYDNSPMPHSIFFRGGYAIHGTGAVSRLGSAASHGCIRLAPGNAATLYNLVQRNRGSTRIVITGSAANRVARGWDDDDAPRAVRRAKPRYASGDGIGYYGASDFDGPGYATTRAYGPRYAPRRQRPVQMAPVGAYYYEVSPGYYMLVGPGVMR